MAARRSVTDMTCHKIKFMGSETGPGTLTHDRLKMPLNPSVLVDYEEASTYNVLWNTIDN